MFVQRSSFWPMFQQLQQMQREMNQLFHRWGGDGNGQPASATFPSVNVWGDVDCVHLEAELPGFELDDMEIYVTGNNQLTLKGERKSDAPENAKWHRQERGFGSFVRVLTLPFAVDGDKVEARLENGILFIDLPKHESAKPRRIAVKTG